MPNYRSHNSSCDSSKMKCSEIGCSRRHVNPVTKTALLVLLAAYFGPIWTAKGWITTTSPAATTGRMFPHDVRSTIFRTKMSNGFEEWGRTYEEQYAAFTKQQQQQQQQRIENEQSIQSKQQERNLDFRSSTNYTYESPNQIVHKDIKVVNQEYNGIHEGGSQDSNEKAQEKLEMAFLDFISVPSQKTKTMPPRSDQQHGSQYPDKTLYADISTSLDFGMFSQYGNGNTMDDARDDEIASKLKSSNPDSINTRAKESIPSDNFANDASDIPATTEYAPVPSSFSTEVIADSSSSQSAQDPAIHVDDNSAVDSTIAHDASDTPATTEYAPIPSSFSTETIADSSSSQSAQDPAIHVDDNAAVENTVEKPSLSKSPSVVESVTAEIQSDDRIDDLSDRIVEQDADALDLNSSEDSDKDVEENYYTIEVRVETTFPAGITVEDAKRGWLEFCWARGGGIVVPVVESAKPPSASKPNSTEVTNAPTTIKFENNDPTDNDRKSYGSETSHESIEDCEIPSGIPSSRELIVPLGMKQELVSSTSTLNEIMADTIRRDVVTYKTTQRGFLCRDMIEDSHKGRVEFVGASYTSTRMIWTVTFQVEQEDVRSSSDSEAATANTKATSPTSDDSTSNLFEFAWNTKTMIEGCSRQFMDSNPGFKMMLSKANRWGSWSQFQLKTASQNLIAYLDNSDDSMPILEHTETLPLGVSPREAMEVWYDYYWKNGGGTIPILFSSKKGADTRWIIPSGLEEELLSLEYEHPVSESGFVGVDGEIATETEIAKAVYRVKNPNLLTYPFHYNRATVRFVRDNAIAPTQLIWKVRLKPYRKFLGGGVLFSTKNGIALASRNLRKYLEFRQVERRERELQAQLERLRIQNSADKENIATQNDAENDDQLPLKGFKKIRSTVSISSGNGALGADYEKVPTRSEDYDDDINKNSDIYAVEKDGQQTLHLDSQSNRPTTFVSPGVEVDQNSPTVKPTNNYKRRPRSIFIPPGNIDSVTTPIERPTHPVDRKENDAWQ